MILVAGATGYLGREICRRLAQQGRRVRAMIRPTSDPDAVAALRRLGVDVVHADLKHPASLASACSGVDVVISTATVTRTRQLGDTIETCDHAGQLNLVSAAAAAGARSFVYVSYSGQISFDDPLTRAKRAVEAAVRESGMTYTILRPTFFMEVWLSPALGFDPQNGHATIYGSGNNPVSWISLGDVAEFAARSLDNPAARNAVVELGGPEALSPLQVVEIFRRTFNLHIDVQLVPEKALRAQLQSATDSLSVAFSTLMLAYAAGDAIPMGDVSRRFGVRLRTVADYARDLLAPPPLPPVAG